MFSDRIVLFGYLNVEGSDGGSYIDRVIFCVVLRIVLVGDETLTEVLRSGVIFWVSSCVSTSELEGKLKVMMRRGDVSEFNCGLYVFGLGLTILVGTLTNWLFGDSSCVEVVDSGVVYSLVLFSFICCTIFPLRFSFRFSGV